MTIWYRASHSEDAEVVFSGEGGLFTAGRWNQLGRKAIYCSESVSLATLEWLAHHGLSVSGFNYYKYAIEVPDELTIKFSKTQLPKNWNATPAAYHSREYAEEQLFSANKPIAMIVPSVMVPEENNIVINPLHEKFSKIKSTIQLLGKYIAPTR